MPPPVVSAANAAVNASSTKLGLAGQLFFGGLCVGTFGLGVWQTQRYFEKIALVEERTRNLQLPPVGLKANNALPFQRWSLAGKYLSHAQVLVGPRGPPPGALPNAHQGGMASSPQGYFILTPLVLLQEQRDNNKQESNTSLPIIWVNRGWIPRSMLQQLNTEGRTTTNTSLDSTQQRQRVRGPNNGASAFSKDDIVKALSCPPDDVPIRIVAVEQKWEEARFLVAEHDMKSEPPRLFWFDYKTLLDYLGLKNSNSESDSPLHDNKMLLVTQLADDNNNNDSTNTATSKSVMTYPLRPPAHAVGDFKVTPMTHAGYAFTWYGLSIAGLYMTRILMTRGRVK